MAEYVDRLVQYLLTPTDANRQIANALRNQQQEICDLKNKLEAKDIAIEALQQEVRRLKTLANEVYGKVI